MSEPEAPRFLDRGGGARIAYHSSPGAAPTVAFLGGYGSDMTGTKARHFEALCRARGQAYLRFDYQGHGASSGRFVDGTVGLWAEDARHVLGALTEGPLVLVGSSLGGWIMVLAALALRDRVRGLLGIASAPDFTEDVMWARFSAGQRAVIERGEVLELPSDYGAPYPVTARFIEDGRRHRVLRGPVDLDCPVRLIHGMGDPDVPWETSLRLARCIRTPDVQLTLLKGSGHRLSEPGELATLGAALERLLGCGV